MSRLNLSDAYPDHPDKQRSHAWLTVETDDSLWDIPVNVEDFPTRPSDAELIPRLHKHNDGHWCDAGCCAADPAQRSFACWVCDMREMEKDDRRPGPSYGRNR